MSSVLRDSLPLFDGFPYLITRVASAVYHVILLPASAMEAELAGLARWQALANQLPACLVLTSDRAVYFTPDDDAFVSQEPPVGGLLVAGHLVPAVDCDDAGEDFRVRHDRLGDLVERAGRRGSVFGDLTKGGHPANDEERRRLKGFLPDGTPKGLHRCATCGDWKGECLDPSEVFVGQVMTVHCACDNRNRCARCNALLYGRRLNANYYNPADQRVWHVPGFCGFEHHCSASTTERKTPS